MDMTVELITAADRVEGDPTAGMVREEAIADDRMWAGLVRSEPGTVSGWHHHGDFETAIYVLSGAIRMEFGPGGGQSVDAAAGDFLRVTPGTIHREMNPGDEELRAIVVRAGSGAPVFNVDGPVR